MRRTVQHARAAGHNPDNAAPAGEQAAHALVGTPSQQPPDTAGKPHVARIERTLKSATPSRASTSMSSPRIPRHSGWASGFLLKRGAGPRHGCHGSLAGRAQATWDKAQRPAARGRSPSSPRESGPLAPAPAEQVCLAFWRILLPQGHAPQRTLGHGPRNMPAAQPWSVAAAAPTSGPTARCAC